MGDELEMRWTSFLMLVDSDGSLWDEEDTGWQADGTHWMVVGQDNDKGNLKLKRLLLHGLQVSTVL